MESSVDYSQTPLVTVCVATYNQARFLPRCLDSLTSQTLSDAFEILVIDDGSTDHTQAVLEAYQDVQVHRQSNQGLVPSCNKGLSLSRGRFFLRVDSDDEVDQDLLRECVDILVNDDDVNLVVTDRVEVGSSGQIRKSVNLSDIYSMVACGVMFRKDQLEDVGGYRPFYWEEYDLFIRTLDQGKTVHLPKPLYSYHRHEGNMTNNDRARAQGWDDLIKEWGIGVLRRFGQHPELEDAWSRVSGRER